MKKWTPVTMLPPPGEDYGDFNHSVDVLITDGRDIFVGYYKFWRDEDYSQWKLKGRDSYTFDNVTHWMALPSLPDK